MKHPKEWQGENVYTYHSTSSSAARVTHCIYHIAMYVYRPGRPHHGRRIITDLTSDQLVALRAAIERQLAIEEDI